MTSPPRTSRQFAAIRALRARLGEQAFPAHHVTGDPVRLPVGFTAVLPDVGAERIGITLNLDETSTEWMRVGPAGRDEEFAVDVWISTNLPGQDDVAVFDRLEQLSEVVQLCTYDEITQRVRKLDYPGEVESARVGAHRFVIVGSGDGFAGQAVVSFQFTGRI